MVLEQKEIQEEGIQLEFAIANQCFVEVNLFDENGQLIYNFSDYISAGHHNHYIHTDKFSAGTYLLRVAQNGNTNTHEMINLK